MSGETPDWSVPAPAATAGDTRWFVHDRFGLVIHWGLYALPARHEWVRHNERTPNAIYDDRYFARFDPDLYDPRQWAAAAGDAGMRYAVVTTKHHEGFCLWDSALTTYTARHTPAGRDLLRPFVDAFRERGIRIGLYYSLIDWHHADFVIDPHFGPHREDPNRAEMNAGRSQQRYAEYLHGQVRELLTGYGPIDILWLDFSYPREGTGKGRADWRSEELVRMVRSLQPRVILNDRLDLPGTADIKTPEQMQPTRWVSVGGQPVVWEACQTFCNSWGYYRDEANWRSVDDLLRTLIDTVSKGGNLLLNVGPTGRGEFDERALARLEGIGAWMRRHGRAIYGCTQAPSWIPVPQDCRLTYHPERRRLYVHILAWPYKHLYLPRLRPHIAYAQLLHDASEVLLKGIDPWQHDHLGDAQLPEDMLVIELPVQKPGVAIPVIELYLR